MAKKKADLPESTNSETTGNQPAKNNINIAKDITQKSGESAQNGQMASANASQKKMKKEIPVTTGEPLDIKPAKTAVKKISGKKGKENTASESIKTASLPAQDEPQTTPELKPVKKAAARRSSSKKTKETDDSAAVKTGDETPDV